MGNLLAPRKTLREQLRENQRMINRAIREIDRERQALQNNQKKIASDIKKMAKEGQMNAVKVLAKDLVRSKRYVERFYSARSQLQAVSMKLQTVRSQEAMTSAMRGVTKALVSMNKQCNATGMQKVLQDFMRENEIAELNNEMFEDAMDDVMEEDDDEVAEEQIVSQVLDELGITMTEAVPEAPVGAAGAAEAAPASAAAASGDAIPAAPVGGGGGGGDSVSELEARLQNLRR